jgi:serine-protein kinase ATM
MLISRRFDDVSQILSCRETLLSSLSKRSSLRDIVNISPADSRLVEVHTSRLSSSLNRTHGALQESLTSATYLTSLIEPCQALGVNIEAAANLEAANALWDQGEMASSIGILRTLEKSSNLKKQAIPIGRSDLLAKLGYQVSVARLEKPDLIIDKYLLPALKELKGKSTGSDAGQVFHEFAVFCDQQLQDVDSQTDLERLKRLKEMKESEVRDLARMAKAAVSSEQKAKYHNAWTKAKQWLQLDSEEYRRLSSSKDELLHQSVENYLLSLIASDNHSNDTLRFSALWLEHSEEPTVNDAVAKRLSSVPTRKFASLMNQLTSRLLNNITKFQQLLFSLVLNICIDHPYHGMYQIYAGCKGRNNTKDETAMSRYAATTKVGQQLGNNQKSAKVWLAISNTNKYYCQLATERNDGFKAGHKVFLKDSSAGSALNQAISRHLLPPPTLQIEVSANLDYSRVPFMQRLDPQFSIASGVSAPKVITAIATDGSKYKQLVRNLSRVSKVSFELTCY